MRQGAIVGVMMGALLGGHGSASGARGEREPLDLVRIGTLGPGAVKEISGIVASRQQPGVFWTLNDSGDEPRVYPVRIDGSVVPSVRYPEIPGTLIGGAINGDWEDIALDASGRLIIADFGNNSNARRDLALYILPEPEATEGRAGYLSKVLFRYPDQRSFPAPKDDFNFDAEALFTIGDEIHVLSKNRSDTFTKLYRLDSREPDAVNTLTYIGRFDVKGECTGADATPDGLKVAVLTYDRVFLFERASIRTPIFAGSVRTRQYRLPSGAGDSESICFDADGSLIIADEVSGGLYRMKLDDLDVVRTGTSAGSIDTPRTRAMTFNIRFAGEGDRGQRAWANRADLVRDVIASSDPDIVGVQEALAEQVDWLQKAFPSHTLVGVGRIDGRRGGEATPILFRTDRYTLLASGHFWLSPTPNVPGSRGWDAACERMATWVRLHDRTDGRTVLAVNTHFDHVGAESRRESARIVRAFIGSTRDGAEVILLGDFNAPADGPNSDVHSMLCAPGSPAGGLQDAYRAVFPIPDATEATFCGWEGAIRGGRIDWVLVSEGWRAESAVIDRRMRGYQTPSDHYPVIVDLVRSQGEKRPNAGFGATPP